jgi:hypothetical protein
MHLLCRFFILHPTNAAVQGGWLTDRALTRAPALDKGDSVDYSWRSLSGLRVSCRGSPHRCLRRMKGPRICWRSATCVSFLSAKPPVE